MELFPSEKISNSPAGLTEWKTEVPRDLRNALLSQSASYGAGTGQEVHPTVPHAGQVAPVAVEWTFGAQSIPTIQPRNVVDDVPII